MWLGFLLGLEDGVLVRSRDVRVGSQSGLWLALGDAALLGRELGEGDGFDEKSVGSIVGRKGYGDFGSFMLLVGCVGRKNKRED